MEADRELRDLDAQWVIDRRARKISDPVKKLRYLQRKMAETRKAAPAPAPAGRICWWRRLLRPAAALALFLLPVATVSDTPWGSAVREIPPLVSGAPANREPKVWCVEKEPGYEVYSNGLRIENDFAVAGDERPYPVYDRQTLELVEWRSGPVGIVYHTTESHLAPFDPQYNSRLRRVGKWLLEYVRRNRSYHFVIDRFGRVHRVVRENGAANHAGYSVWADARHVYVNLNPSFLGVALETQTVVGRAAMAASPAQIHAAKVLTEMLRSRYHIPAANCVTHAQVSVNQWSMRVGTHTDWAASFPFGELGLGDNYDIPVPAMAVFGFRYDLEFLQATGPALWKGALLGEDLFRLQAASRHVTVAQLRAARKQRYRKILKVIEEAIASDEETTS